VPSGPVPDKDDVIVGIDDAGNDGSAFEVHNRQSATAPNDVIADCRNPAVADEHLRYHLAGAIHCVDLPVDETEISCTVGRALSVQPDGAGPPCHAKGQAGSTDESSA
jgi:hypothetical protein